MEKSQAIPYRGISLFFVLVMAVITWGFYKTYIIFFPSFTGFNNVQHFHGAMMVTWMLFLIVQPLLIRSGKITIHRTIGKLSYVIAPLLIVSIFLASRMVYHRPEPILPHEERIAGIALSIPFMFAFAILYSLAIINRKNTYQHMRYMIAGALVLLGPTVGRMGPILFGWSGLLTQNIQYAIIYGILVGLLIYDGKKVKNNRPYVLAAIFFMLHQLVFYIMFL